VLNTAVAALARATRIEPVNQRGLHGSVYHLIARGGAAAYRAAIEEAAATVPSVHVIISGPSPAYAFG
jgi:hypothetical protein